MNEPDSCTVFQLLLQAEIDGELCAAETAPAVAHRLRCQQCEAFYARQLRLHQQFRSVPRATASDDFRRRMMQTLQASEPASINIAPATPGPVAQRNKHQWREILAMAAGLVLLGGLTIRLLYPSQDPLAAEIVADHVRALQVNHLLDVVSTDQHNVKPWFEGRLDYAPPVKNLADVNFPLIGGRLDYINGRTVAVTIFQRGKHPINLYAWPERKETAMSAIEKQGFNVVSWHQDGMAIWAISDLNLRELRQFAEEWQRR